MNHLREALGDSAEQPRFIETLPRKGYRFIAPVTCSGEDVERGPAGRAAAAAASRDDGFRWRSC